MKKPLLWINSLSTALHAGLDSAVSEELRATTSNICSWSRSRKMSASNDAGNPPGDTAQTDRKVA